MLVYPKVEGFTVTAVYSKRLVNGQPTHRDFAQMKTKNGRDYENCEHQLVVDEILRRFSDLTLSLHVCGSFFISYPDPQRRTKVVVHHLFSHDNNGWRQASSITLGRVAATRMLTPIARTTMARALELYSPTAVDMVCGVRSRGYVFVMDDGRCVNVGERAVPKFNGPEFDMFLARYGLDESFVALTIEVVYSVYVAWLNYTTDLRKEHVSYVMACSHNVCDAILRRCEACWTVETVQALMRNHPTVWYRQPIHEVYYSHPRIFKGLTDILTQRTPLYCEEIECCVRVTGVYSLSFGPYCLSGSALTEQLKYNAEFRLQLVRVLTCELNAQVSRLASTEVHYINVMCLAQLLYAILLEHYEDSMLFRDYRQHQHDDRFFVQFSDGEDSEASTEDGYESSNDDGLERSRKQIFTTLKSIMNKRQSRDNNRYVEQYMVRLFQCGDDILGGVEKLPIECLLYTHGDVQKFFEAAKVIRDVDAGVYRLRLDVHFLNDHFVNDNLTCMNTIASRITCSGP